MDLYPVVEVKLEDGRRLLNELSRQGCELAAAGWLQTETDGRPYLYLVPPASDPTGGAGLYAAADSATLAIRPSQVSLFDVKVMPTAHPVGRTLALNAGRYLGTPPQDTTVYPPDGRFIGFDVQGPVHLYALPALTPAPAA